MSWEQRITDAAIMIVADGLPSGTDLETRLRGLGYRVSAVVGSTEKLWERAESDQPDLILMDVDLERATAWLETAKNIHTHFAIPLVFATAHADQTLLDQMGVSLPFAFVVQPFQDQELRSSIEMALYAARVDAERRQAERALRESEERHRTLFENMINGIAVYEARNAGEDFVCVDINKAGEKISAISRDAMVGRSVLEVFPGVKDFGFFDVLQRVWRTGQPEFLPLSLYSDARISQWVENAVYKLPSGEIVAVYTDETERKRTEEALRESEEKYRRLVDNALVGVYRTTLSGEFLFANKAYLDILQSASFEALRPGNIATFCRRPEQRDVLVQKLQTKGKARLQELEIVTATGKNKTIIESAVLEHGIISGMALDITERKQSESDRHLLVTAIEQTGETVMITDADGNIQYVNPAFEKTTGYECQEVMGRNPRILKSGKHDAMFYKVMWEKLKRGDKWTGRLINKKKDGTLFEEDVAISPILDGARAISNYVAVKRDITEQIKLEKQFHQAQKMEAIGTLAGGIAHDFNNILGIIFGYTELAYMNAGQGTEHRSHLEEVLRAGNRAKDLVQQILTFSRQTDMESKPVQVSLIIKETLKLLRATLPATIEMHSDIQSDSLVMADPTRIHQVLVNLCTNAGHAMRDKGGILLVALDDVNLDSEFTDKHPDLRPGAYLRLTVGDTGYGISAEIRDRIFDPFFTTKGKNEGTGLGLSVVHGIIDSLGGTVAVYSEPGKGSTFNVFLPVIERNIVPEHTSATPLPRGCERILLVDDEPSLLTLGQRLLASLGYQVEARTNGFEALELFKSKPDGFDLVITDMTMPYMAGMDLAQAISKVRSDIPIMLCTGFGGDGVLTKDMETFGIRGLLLKPIVFEELARSVRKALDGESD